MKVCSKCKQVIVKYSRNKSWKLRGGKESWDSILTLIFGATRTAQMLALRAGCIYPQRNSLVLISVSG
jgi:hypothetical protein